MLKKRVIIVMSIFALTLLVMSIPVLGQEDISGTQQDEVVATIDGEDVYMSELEQEAGLQQLLFQLQQQSPEFTQFLFSSPEGAEFLQAYKKNRLDQLIANKLLNREADKENIVLTDNDKDLFFQQQLELIKKQYSMNDDDLLEALEQQGINSLDEFKENIIQQEKGNLIIKKLIETVALNKVNVTEDETRKLYEQRQYQVGYEEAEEQLKLEIAEQKYVNNLVEETEIEILMD